MRQNESLNEDEVKHELDQLFGPHAVDDEEEKEDENNDSRILMNFWLLFCATFLVGVFCVFISLNMDFFDVILPEKTVPLYNLLYKHNIVNKHK